MALELFAHADARIGARILQRNHSVGVGHLLAPECDRATRTVVFDGVGQEIQKQALQVRRARQNIGMLDDIFPKKNLHAAAGCMRLHKLHELGIHRVHVEWGLHERNLAALKLACVKNLVHKVEQQGRRIPDLAATLRLALQVIRT